MQRILVLIMTLVLLGALSLLLAGELEPPGIPAPTMTSLGGISTELDKLSASYQFVEVTTAATTGRVGWKNLNQVCVNEFSATYPTIRMCTTSEIMNTPVATWPSIASTHSHYWAHPTVVANSADAWMDISGYVVSDPRSLSCSSWTFDTISGMALTNNGALSELACSNAVGVTCCASEDELP